MYTETAPPSRSDPVQVHASAPKRLVRRRAMVALLTALVSVGCRRGGSEADEGELRIFAAASLRDAFGNLGKEFERARPGTRITFNFAGTQELRTQLEQGAEVDVFASADQRHMDELVRSALVSAPLVFAHNEPVVVVSKESRELVRTFADLPRADRIVLGTSEVPIGRYSQQILERASAALGTDFRSRVEAKVVSRELNVRQVLAKVSLGEAQAAIVYHSDAVAAASQALVVPIPPELNVVAVYPIAVVTRAPHPGLAQAWVDFVLSPEAQRTLEQAGFLPLTATSTKS